MLRALKTVGFKPNLLRISVGKTEVFTAPFFIIASLTEQAHVSAMPVLIKTAV